MSSLRLCRIGLLRKFSTILTSQSQKQLQRAADIFSGNGLFMLVQFLRYCNLRYFARTIKIELAFINVSDKNDLV